MCSICGLATPIVLLRTCRHGKSLYVYLDVCVLRKKWYVNLAFQLSLEYCEIEPSFHVNKEFIIEEISFEANSKQK